MAKRLTAKELAAFHGITVRQVRVWVKDGLPHGTMANKHGGKRLWTFSPAVVDRWLARNGIITKGMEGRAMSNAPDQEEQGSRPKRQQTPENYQEIGIEGMLARAEMVERKAAADLFAANKNRAPAADVAAYARVFWRAQDNLRKTKAAAMGYMIKRGELVSRAKVAKVWSRENIMTRDAVMGIGRKVIPRLKRYLKDHNAASSVEKILNDAAREALRHVSDSDSEL